MSPFNVLSADCPWPFKDRLPGKSRGAAKNYALLSIADLCAFPLPPIADDAVLFLWRVSSMVEEAYQVCRAWGFTPKSEIVWRKMTSGGLVHFGMGRTVRLSHETCIIATRGRPKRWNAAVRSVFDAEVRSHSEKPEAFYRLVEAMYAGPYAELFGRRERAGWTVLGNEVGKLAAE